MKRILILAAALLAAGTACAQEAYREQRRSLFELLPIRSSDIVFLGNSLTDGCEWSELFDNRHIRNRGISSDRACELAERLDPIVEGTSQAAVPDDRHQRPGGRSRPRGGRRRHRPGHRTASRPIRAGRGSSCKAPPVNGGDFDAYQEPLRARRPHRADERAPEGPMRREGRDVHRRLERPWPTAKGCSTNAIRTTACTSWARATWCGATC